MPDFAAELNFWKTAFLGPNRSDFLRDLVDPEACRNCLPPVVARILRERFYDQPAVLDVGCGPLSVLRWLADRGRIRLSCVDPLAAEYRALLADHNLPAPSDFQAVSGERLVDFFSEGRFDLVYMRNALDHSADPAECVRQISRVLRPGGFFVLESKIDEGSAAGWRGLHQWNLRMEHYMLILENQAGIKSWITGRLVLFREYSSVSDEWFTSVWMK